MIFATPLALAGTCGHIHSSKSIPIIASTARIEMLIATRTLSLLLSCRTKLIVSFAIMVTMTACGFPPFKSAKVKRARTAAISQVLFYRQCVRSATTGILLHVRTAPKRCHDKNTKRSPATFSAVRGAVGVFDSVSIQTFGKATEHSTNQLSLRRMRKSDVPWR